MSEYSLAKEILARAFPNERLVAQSADLWHGAYPLPDEVARYYLELGPASVTIEGYGNPYFLPGLADLWAFQAGYRFHPDTLERFEDWADDWLVIADEGADPFIYSRGSGKIMHAQHGRGVWEPGELFPSLAAMVSTLAIIGEVVVNAGEELTDDEGYLGECHVKEAVERVWRVLGAKEEAEGVLESLGWSGGRI